MDDKKKITILGSTGSIGRSTLDVVRQLKERVEVVAMTAWKNIGLFADQVLEFQPQVVSVCGKKEKLELQDRIGTNNGISILAGDEGLEAVSKFSDSELIISAIWGTAGLLPTYWAACSGKNLALSNKESLVMAGDIITKIVKMKGSKIIPIDSEHAAIHQCIGSMDKHTIEKIILTASGGPFYNLSSKDMENITPTQALNHPVWKMGRKISIDSATMMNKGLEVIEAKWLFNVDPKKIDIIIHPQSIIHSMLEYIDGSIMALLSLPDMRFPIARAITYPECIPIDLPHLDLAAIGKLTFIRPDFKKFPCLDLAYQALEAGKSATIVLNAANEIAVSAFLKGEIKFVSIPKIIYACLNKHSPKNITEISSVFEIDKWAKNFALEIINNGVLKGVLK